MMQTFNDLCREWQQEATLIRFGLQLWLFIETGFAMIQEWIGQVMQDNTKQARKTMEIRYMSVLVDDQDKALQFYTEKLGFVKKSDGQDGTSPLRWLTVVSPNGPDGVELELQATYFPSAKAYQRDQYEAGYAYAIFQTQNIYTEYNRLKNLGVVFRGEPEDTGPVLTVKFEDTCGNLINMIQLKQ